MPLYHCTKCHHEWEGSKNHDEICDWCHASGYVIAEQTHFEQFMQAWREGKINLNVPLSSLEED